MPKIKCVECGKFFTVPHVRPNSRKICGDVCRQARGLRARRARLIRIKKKCVLCGKVFFTYRSPNYTPVGGKYGRKTCSFECGRQWDIDRSTRWQKAHPKYRGPYKVRWYHNNRDAHIENVRCWQARRAGITGATPWGLL